MDATRLLVTAACLGAIVFVVAWFLGPRRARTARSRGRQEIRKGTIVVK